VAGVDVAGGLEREIHVLIDHIALEKYGLSLELIERRLREENLTRLGGRVTGANQETIVRTRMTDRSSVSVRAWGPNAPRMFPVCPTSPNAYGSCRKIGRQPAPGAPTQAYSVAIS